MTPSKMLHSKDLIAEIRVQRSCPLTLHGGSGTDDEDLRKAIAAGINTLST